MSEQENMSIKRLDLDKELIDIRLIAGVVLIIVAGVASGYGIFRLQAAPGESVGRQQSEKIAGVEKVKVGETYGNQSEVFPDKATGVIERNEEDGEGTHKLIREGGESQTAYLTSSLVNLDRFVNHKVTVWGETFAAQKVGWLMDVGAVKVLE